MASNHLQPSETAGSRRTRRSLSTANMQQQGSGESGYASSNTGKAPVGRSTRRSTRGATADASFENSPDLNHRNGGGELPDMDENGEEQGEEEGEGEGGNYGEAPPPPQNGSRKKRPPVVLDSEEEEERDAEGEVEEGNDVEMGQEEATSSRNGRRGGRGKAAPKEEDYSESEHEPTIKRVLTTTSHGRQTTRPVHYPGASSDEDDKPRRSGRGRLQRGGARRNSDFVVGDEEYDQEDAGYGEQPKRSSRLSEKTRLQKQRNQPRNRRNDSYTSRSQPKARNTRNSQKVDTSFEGDEEVETESSGGESQDFDEDDEEGKGGPRQLREKKEINYYAIPELEQAEKSRGKGKSSNLKFGRGSDPFGNLPQNLSAAGWEALYPDKGPAPADSVCFLLNPLMRLKEEN